MSSIGLPPSASGIAAYLAGAPSLVGYTPLGVTYEERATAAERAMVDALREQGKLQEQLSSLTKQWDSSMQDNQIIKSALATTIKEKERAEQEKKSACEHLDDVTAELKDLGELFQQLQQTSDKECARLNSIINDLKEQVTTLLEKNTNLTQQLHEANAKNQRQYISVNRTITTLPPTALFAPTFVPQSRY